MWELPFTISLHENFGEPHLDLFLDIDGNSRLITFGTVASNWAPLQKGTGIEFLRKDDHRRVYLDLEGELNGKGKLKILLRGSAKLNARTELVSEWNRLTATLKDGTLML